MRNNIMEHPNDRLPSNRYDAESQESNSKLQTAQTVKHHVLYPVEDIDISPERIPQQSQCRDATLTIAIVENLIMLRKSMLEVQAIGIRVASLRTWRKEI